MATEREVLGLEAHPEGGWFVESWRSDLTVRPDGYSSDRSAGTCIYFSLRPGEESAWHTVASTELWFWHGPGELRLWLGGSGPSPDAGVEPRILGRDLSAGQRPQVIVPPGIWQRAEPVGDEPVLVSCVVCPGFDFADFRLLDG